jgi:glyoxylase-like metal-dependent hydrolase (beta-lactamase superfamily II)
MSTLERPVRQAAGLYHRNVGDMTVTALNDGAFGAAFAYLTNIPESEAEALHVAAFRAVPPAISIACFLLRTPSRLVLIDGGAGTLMGPGLGALDRNLAALGVEAGDIDTILLTHLHLDHVGGLYDAAGAAKFPNAELVVHADEAGFWGAEATLASAPSDDFRGWVQIARTCLAAYEGRVRTLTSGEALPGVSIVAEPGHTPGHSGWMVSSGSESLLVWGDIVHMPGVQFARPGAGMGFDVDGAGAIASRRRIFDMAATDRLAVAGMHLDFPCFGHVARASEGYAFVPEVWAPGL